MGTRIKWFPPDKEPLCDALVVTDKGKMIWRSWYGAAPSLWFCWCRDYGVKKWRKIFKFDVANEKLNGKIDGKEST